MKLEILKDMAQLLLSLPQKVLPESASTEFHLVFVSMQV